MKLIAWNTRRVPRGQQHVWKTNRSQRSPWTCVMSWTSIFHWDTILMRYSYSVQRCHVVTSRFGNKQQRLMKSINAVLGSRLCCTGTGKCSRKSEEIDLWTGVLCWSLVTARRIFRTFPMAEGARQDLHALISFRNTTNKWKGYHSTHQHRKQGFGSLCRGRGGPREATSLLRDDYQ